MGPGSSGGRGQGAIGDAVPVPGGGASAVAAFGSAGAVLFVDNDVQRRVIDMHRAIDVMSAAYREWSDGGATIRPKTNLYVYNPDGRTRYGFSTMEGGARDLRLVAIRIKSDIQPLHQVELREGESVPMSTRKSAGREGLFCGLVYLFDAGSGLPLAILNDGHLQHVRVAASAALAARHLARPEASVLGLLGSGWMARSHAVAMSAVRPIARIRVYSPRVDHRTSFAREMGARLGVDVEVCERAEAAADGADILCCCTNSVDRPVLPAEAIPEGAFVSNVLSAEIGPEALARFDYAVKNQPLRPLDNAVFEAGPIPAGVRPRYEGSRWPALVSDATPLLSDVVAGRAPGRTGERQVTFFCNNEGTGLQFAAVGRVVLDALWAAGCGESEEACRANGVKTMPLQWFLQDIPD